MYKKVNKISCQLADTKINGGGGGGGGGGFKTNEHPSGGWHVG